MTRPAAPLPLSHLAAYGLFLVVAALVWYLDASHTTFDSRDARLALWLARLHFTWGGPFDLTILNPFQGMAGMAIPLNPWWTPPMLPAVLLEDSPLTRTLVMVVASLEITAGSWVLLRVLGFGPRLVLCAILFAHFLLFPPFNFAFAFHGWLQTGPFYGHTIALGQLLLAVFVLIGRIPGRAGTRRRKAALWSLLTLCALVLVLANLVSVPFYAAGMLVGFAGLGAVVLFATPGMTGRACQLLSALAVLVVLVALQTATFYVASRQISVRFDYDAGLLTPLLRPEMWTLGWKQLEAWFCGQGIACTAGAFGPGATLRLVDSVWIQLAALAGAALAALRGTGPVRRFATGFLAYDLLLLLYWLLASQHILGPAALAPVYFYLALYPFWALFSLHAVASLAGQAAVLLRRRAGQAEARPRPGLRLAVDLAPGILAAALAGCFALAVVPGAGSAPSSTPLTDMLRDHAGLAPGAVFRGSSATILGAPGSFLRQTLGPPGGQAVPPHQFDIYLSELAVSTGSPHALLDLWQHDIPTLEEYGQAFTRPMGLFEQALSGDEYVDDRHFLTVDLPVLPLLQALGVRFVLSDTDLASQGQLYGSLPLRGGGWLYLFELPDPNLGTYSPTRITSGLSAEEIMAEIRRDPGRLRHEAFAEGIAGGGFVPAQEASMRFERGGVRVHARSEGRTALLLPLQFSHCLELEDAAPGTSLHRANLAQTLLLFDREADLFIRWRFGPVGQAACRAEDVAELRTLGL